MRADAQEPPAKGVAGTLKRISELSSAENLHNSEIESDRKSQKFQEILKEIDFDEVKSEISPKLENKYFCEHDHLSDFAENHLSDLDERIHLNFETCKAGNFLEEITQELSQIQQKVDEGEDSQVGETRTDLRTLTTDFEGIKQIPPIQASDPEHIGFAPELSMIIDTSHADAINEGFLHCGSVLDLSADSKLRNNFDSLSIENSKKRELQRQ